MRFLSLLLLSSLFSIANGITLYPMNVNVQAGDTLTFCPFSTYWDSTATNISVEKSNPSNGTVDVIQAWFVNRTPYSIIDSIGKKAPKNYPGFRYIPNKNFTGIDSFTYRITTSSGNSNTVKCVIRVTPPEPGAMKVLLIVRQAIYTAVQSDVERLKNDLEREGYTARIISMATSSDGKPVWDTLSAEYNKNGTMLAGAILIGNMSFSNDESAFFCMSGWEPQMKALDDSTMIGYVVGKGAYDGKHYTPGFHNIWVSRMSGFGYFGKLLGTETELVKRILQNNHDYRNNISRLPHTAHFYSMYLPSNKTTQPIWSRDTDPSKYLDVWPEQQTRAPNDSSLHPFRKEYRKGGQIWEFITHASYHEYRATYNGSSSSSIYIWRYNITKLWNAVVPFRFIFSNNCHTGAVSQLTHFHLLTRNSGCVLAVGQADYVSNGYYLCDTGSTFPAHSRIRQYLSEGDRWGRAWLRGNGWLWTVMFHGDLTLKPNMDTPNEKPFISFVEAEETGPLTWKFTATATDADDSITGYEWWGKSYDGGITNSDSVGISNTFTYKFPSNALCTVRVEAVDRYKARDWVEVVIKPDSGLVNNPVTNCEFKTVRFVESPLISPNPFNPGTTIILGRIQGVDRTVPSVDVYSTTGKLVKRGVTDNLNVFNWNGKDMEEKDVASGTYIFKIKSGSKVWKIKGTLIR